jgi:hypothetical protein
MKIKSYILKKIIEYLENKYNTEHIYIEESTNDYLKFRIEDYTIVKVKRIKSDLENMKIRIEIVEERNDIIVIPNGDDEYE